MELRKNPLKNLWTAMAPERSGRPGDLTAISKQTPTDPSSCPFCPGNEKCTPSDLYTFTEHNNWQLRVFANKYPALRVEGTLEGSAEGFYDVLTPIGAHEVIVPSRVHDLKMQNYDSNLFNRLFNAAKNRMTDLEKDFRFAYIDFFQNKGAHAGASIYHPHFQILAMPVIPQKTLIKLESSLRHYNERNRCLCCDLINIEKKSGRVVAESENFIAFISFAAISPFEISIFPLKHSHEFYHMNDTEIFELSTLMERCFIKTGNTLDDPYYNMVLYTSPTNSAIRANSNYVNIKQYYHWHIEITPVLNHLGGVEHSGMNINTVLPETAAKLLRGNI